MTGHGDDLRSEVSQLRVDVDDLQAASATTRELANAADRDVTEIRVLFRGQTTVLNARRTTQVEHTRALHDIAAAVGGLTSQVGALNTHVTELRADVTELRADLTDLRTDVTDLRTDLTRFGADLTDLRTDLTRVRTGPALFRHNFINGRSVPVPLPTGDHLATIVRMQRRLGPALPRDLVALLNFRWRLGPDDFWTDVFVAPRAAVDHRHSTGTPALVVDVLPTAPPDDELLAKLLRYGEVGLPRHWIVDLHTRSLAARVLVDGGYEITTQLDDDNAAAELETGAGPVWISLPDLLT